MNYKFWIQKKTLSQGVVLHKRGFLMKTLGNHVYECPLRWVMLALSRVGVRLSIAWESASVAWEVASVSEASSLRQKYQLTDQIIL